MQGLQKKRFSEAEKAWFSLALYVAATDVWLIRRGEDTLSIQFGKWLQVPRHRAITVVATSYMLLHLYWVLPLPGQRTLRKLVTKRK